MRHLFRSLILITVILIIAAASACTSPGGGTSSPPASQTPGPGGGVPVLSPTGAITTAGTLSAAGQSVFAGKCAGCHGDSGQGKTAPALIGSGAQLAKYITAAALNQKIITTMPMNAPGSLTPADYLNVTTYILVQNNYVNASSQISIGALSSIPLK